MFVFTSKNHISVPSRLRELLSRNPETRISFLIMTQVGFSFSQRSKRFSLFIDWCGTL